MFGHIFRYRFKCLVRDRMLLFWTLMYPLVLASLFSLAFSNLSSADVFKSIPIAVVNDTAYQADTAFQGALASVSDDNPSASQKLFHVETVTRDEAEADLKDNKIKGYVTLGGGAQVVVKESGNYQTILKGFVDSYLQARSAFGAILASNPAAAQGFQAPDTAGLIKEVAPGKTDADGTMTYFYALIAMAALFGGFWGNKEINEAQADQSAQGARLNLSPVHKLKAIAASLCAAVLVQFLALVVLVAYLGLVLGVDFGGQLAFVLLGCLAGSFTGVTYGAFIGSITAKNEHLKIGLLIAVSMLMSFLAGLMVQSIKYTVTHAVPILAYINPANLISDAFYSLYYYSSYTRFFTNVGLLFALSAVFCLAVYFVTRRQKYASL